MLLEIFLICLLIGVNGLLAMSELAVVSSRKVRLRSQAHKGNRGAEIALALAEDPGKFLSTVQIGITLVGILAGAFSGATIGLRLSNLLRSIGVPDAAADEVGVGLVVVAITFLSLIVGELVPKQIALAAPERVASRVAPGMLLLSRVAAPVVWLLDRTGKLVLHGIGHSGRHDAPVSDEDIHTMLTEAAGAGVIHRAEKDLIGGVMRFSDRYALGLMTPRRDVEIAKISETRAEILARFQSSGHSCLPLQRKGPDDIIGVLHSRDLLTTTNENFDARALMSPAVVIPSKLPALDVIDRLRTSPGHMLLVYGERGHFEGIVTPMDVLGTIAGGFDEGAPDATAVIRRQDGSLLVAGSLQADAFKKRVSLKPGPRDAENTVADMVMDHLDEVPTVGQAAIIEGWRFEIVDMDGARIDKLMVQRDAPP
jgi:putative hemolysin